MKYSEALIKKTIAAINNHPVHSFWGIHRRSQCDGIEFCEIRFETLDGVKMSIIITGNDIDAFVYADDDYNASKWFGSCNLSRTNNDTYMMWLGIKLSQMSDFAEEITKTA